MPDDDPPLSSTVTETVTTDTGADKEDVASLNDSFEDFWKEEDSKTEGAPEAPGDGAAQETKETKAERRPRTEGKAEPEIADSVPEKPKEYSDEEIDKLAMTRSDRPEAIEDFKQLKTIIKTERSRTKAESERAAKAERERDEARANSWTPEAKADYEHAAAVRRKFDVASDPDFIAKFHKPMIDKYHDLLNEVVEFLPVRAEAQAWARQIAENYDPDSPELTKSWWNHSVIDKIQDETDKTTARQTLADMLRMQKERAQEVHRRSNDKSAYDNWIKERDLAKSQWEVKEVMDEIGIQEQQLKDILRKDPAKAKTKEEREAIEKHNEDFDRYNGQFQEVMKDLSFNGPRAKVRAAIYAPKAAWIEDKYKAMEKEFNSVKAERDQLRTELEKIQGARRRIANTTGTPPASKDKANGSSLSLSKDGLDVHKSFERFNWGDST